MTANALVKRLIALLSCSLFLVANVAAAWAACKQISFGPDYHHHAAVPGDHHAESHREHSNEARIHCLILEPFIPSSVFSAAPDRGLERWDHRIGYGFAAPMADPRSHCFIHDPPAGARARAVSSHLFLSVLRI